ncbi:MAG: hypothetical protein PVI22_14840 [Lysobacterales bacterium]
MFNRAIILILGLALCALLAARLVSTGPDAQPHGPGPAAAEPGDSAQATIQAPGPARDAEAERAESVAVLPFAVTSSGPDDDYFADGLTEEIIDALSQVPGLRVTARTSAFHFKGHETPIASIAHQLGVDDVVEGSVQRAGSRLRITARLVRVDNGLELWSDSYDRQTEDTFAVQTDIAEMVAQALNVVLDDSLREQMQRVGTRSVDAFIAYQKGFELYQRAHSEPNRISLLRQANAQFEDAVRMAPDLFPAYDLHTDLYSHILISNAAGQLDGDITERDVTEAPAALRRDFVNALRSARNFSEQSNTAFDRALMLGPWRGLALLGADVAATPGCEPADWLHLVTPFPGQAGGMLNALRQTAACDPLNVQPTAHIAGAELWLGQADEAVRSVRVHEARADDPVLSRYRVLALALGGDVPAARKAANASIRSEDQLLSIRAMLDALAGDNARAEAAETEYLGKYGPNDREALVMEAVRGQRGEANRLAGEIDARPFGHIVLLQAIYACFCGAPFDIGATPAFASLISESGLDWPPAKPYEFPLKDW